MTSIYPVTTTLVVVTQCACSMRKKSRFLSSSPVCLVMWSRELSFLEEQPKPQEKEHIDDKCTQHKQEGRVDLKAEKQAKDEQEAEHQEE